MQGMQATHSRIPIIRLWSILLVTLQGEITDEFARNLSVDTLARIHQDGASGVVIDITGLWVLDSHLCSLLAELASAASLMGVRTIISGMNPDIALTLETMGVGLGNVDTTLDLESALSELGVRIVETRPRHEHDDEEIAPPEEDDGEIVPLPDVRPGRASRRARPGEVS
jgi:rsbT antagonist protein RsbS